ncbi:hypothetical protein R1sor_022412 [Riccia sorocarpa]|uniref:C3H1-type domain-containing protein n=1 Tax=Riccia sorocarpa TaxID=122646 RepID=A0ABD3GLH8_9MARC
MAHARDLYKTKLCTLYQRGNCPRQSCSFAHGEAELRKYTGGGFIGMGLWFAGASLDHHHDVAETAGLFRLKDPHLIRGDAPDDRDGSPLHDSSAIARKKRLHAVREKTRALTRNLQQNGDIIRLKPKEDEILPESDIIPGPLITLAGSEKPSKVDMFIPIETGASKERIVGDDLSLSLRSSPIEKVKSRDVRSSLPNTGLAANAGDGEVEDEKNRASDKDIRNPNLDLELGKSYQIDTDSSYRHPSPQLRVSTCPEDLTLAT